ncbi:alpha-hydroxyketone-type quorum-sensing autoinducer synthase [Herbaspirillum sp. SJZ107]|uniref:alpha-hydroxyketone-type quorum-sensing autoinducer synthase n=1 Tax=Herbaspirillum sp. SJZ107 TaxID=2572881 RepID=UPI00114E75EE|nr:alpha-hydroxyketone-type quorum-sensing autoinducer synthase [Herbaspirillum sp. SJZ107]TQK11898.1 CAI-1 autoinducer synthase [Herbaspirillum sp. SJZ107]
MTPALNIERFATQPAARRMPEFVTRRMDEHYVTRVQKLLGGEHMHVWAPPQAGAVMLAGNDYLCIANEPALIDAQVRTLQGTQGQMLMSSVFLQEGSFQHRLEAKLAAFMQAEDGVLAQSGWAANVGLLQSIAEPGIPVYLDMLAHASLWEGVQSAQALPVPFLHNSPAHLERQIEKHGGGVIVIDALYSTNGSVAPLLEFVELAERSGSILIVDESHSLGTHGPGGAGLVVQEGLTERVHFRTASLAKAFAGRAGFITCSSHFKGYFLSASRPAIFSSCLLNHELAWFDAAVDFISGAEDRRAALHRNTQEVRARLSELGYCIDDGTEQIIALEAGPEPKTLVLRKALEARGIYGAVFCAPATAKNRSLVRLTLNSGMTREEIEKLVAACADMRSEVDLDNWSSSSRRKRMH